MRPPIPPPGLLRAIPGFILGFVIGILIVGGVRTLQGIAGPGDLPDYFINLDDPDHLYMGRFMRDEALLMFGLLFGAFGFMWGTGALWGTPIGPKETNPYAIVAVKPKKTRIPSDPDAPIDTATPARQILGVAPSTAILIGVLVVSALLMLLIPLIGLGADQVYSEEASASNFGEGSFNFLGLYTFEDMDQAVLLIGFSVIVILLILGAPMGLALLFYILNREVKEAEVEAPNPEAGQDFILVRLVGFFNQWVLDAVNTFGRGIRTR